jgi:hypothetical protein
MMPGLSVLSLRFEVIDDRPDWPAVQVLVDGRDPFAAVAPGWRGFDPAKILGPDSPLLPADQGRRVAVYCCPCGEPGCGVIAPVIFPWPDGRRVSWVDFHDYTGVFDDPVVNSPDENEGRSWDLLRLAALPSTAEGDSMARPVRVVGLGSSLRAAPTSRMALQVALDGAAASGPRWN